MSIEENKDTSPQSQVANRPWEPRVGDVVRARGQSVPLTVTRMWRATVAEPEPEVEVFGAHCGIVLLPLDAVELVARALCPPDDRQDWAAVELEQDPSGEGALTWLCSRLWVLRLDGLASGLMEVRDRIFGGHVEFVHDPAELPPARPIDANTAALIQAGERREQAERCGKCESPVKVNGEQRTCARCSASWRVRRPAAAQSPWVPDEPNLPGERDFELQQLREEIDFARRAEQRAAEEKREAEQLLRVSESRLAAAHSTIERLRGELRARDEEIERLQTTNALQAPAERCVGADIVAMRLADVLSLRLDAFAQGDDALELTLRAIDELRAALRDCLQLGPHRIEFGVKEVLP